MKTVWLGAALWTAALHAQTFEAATVKRTAPGTRAFRLSAEHGTLTGRNVTLLQYIGFAYDILPAQISGAPSWAGEDTFDILAKGTAGTSDEQVRSMLQSLLAERFDLKLHHEEKELPVYVLTVSKGGVKLHESKQGYGGFRIGRGRVHAEGVKLEDFAAALSGRVGRQVLDETGLTSAYDIDLQWTPEAAPPSANADEASPDPNGPSLFSAIREQLGLRLESRKAPVDLIVLDHVSHTLTAN